MANVQLEHFHARGEATNCVLVRGLNLDQIRVALAQQIKRFEMTLARFALCSFEVRDALQVMRALLLKVAKLGAQREPRAERESGIAQLRRAGLKARVARRH